MLALEAASPGAAFLFISQTDAKKIIYGTSFAV
jgi:hypothetical protein